MLPDNDGSYLEEPPDTPAPLFAVRAFKSALFGTPHPDVKSANNSPKASDNNPQKQRSEDLKLKPVNTGREGPAIIQKGDSLLSPTKGILLTPGTATTRRKNVSFSGLALTESKETKKTNENEFDKKTNFESQRSSSTMDFPPVNQHRQTNLTKALYKARINGSKTDVDKQLSKHMPEKEITSVQEKTDDSKFVAKNQEPVSGGAADVTVDLNEPFSRSGQHWKAEFERYHKKSDREMRKIIKYGQNVKSYAVKKDSEVLDLGEKLKRELSKVATMEASVTTLAAQLASTRKDDPKETSEQAWLVNDLAKQTALAVRYKQKADRCKIALMKQNSATHVLESSIIGGTATPTSKEIPSLAAADSHQGHGLTQELDSLRTDLGNFRTSAQRAERKAARLETENLALQKTIVRLKEEMKLNETKRMAREENIQKKYENLRASKAESDIRFTKLSSDYQKLVSRGEQPNSPQGKLAEGDMYHHENHTMSAKKDAKPTTEVLEPFGRRVDLQSLKLVPKHRQQHSHVDIWTMGGMDSTLPLEKSIDDTTANPFAESTSSILKEIDQNIVPEINAQKPSSTNPSPTAPLKPANLLSDDLRITSPLCPPFPSPLPSAHSASQKLKSSAANRMRARRSIIPSPRPSMLNFASSPQKPLPSSFTIPPPASSLLTLDNPLKPISADDKSSGLGSFTSRAGVVNAGRRVSGLPDDRVAAAKARLQKRREDARLGEKVRAGKGK